VSRGAAAAHLQRRPDLMNRVSRLLQPGADLPSDAYYCILGAPNSGKTHIVRKACEEVHISGPTMLECPLQGVNAQWLKRVRRSTSCIWKHQGSVCGGDEQSMVVGNPVSRCACVQVGGGVIYMQITVPDMFGQELATAIDCELAPLLLCVLPPMMHDSSLTAPILHADQGGALNVMNMIQNNIVKARRETPH
jgi:hypothetical protein